METQKSSTPISDKIKSIQIISEKNEIDALIENLPFELDPNKSVEDVRRFLNDPMNFVNEERNLSYSSLKQFRKSPLHYLKYLFSEYSQTPAMLLGSVIDEMILTPEKIDERIVVSPKFNRRTNAGKEEYEQFMESNKGKLVIDEVQYETAIKAVSAVYKDKDAMYYIERIKRTQVPLKFKHKESGLTVRGFVDGEGDPEEQDYFILDLKSASDASSDKFVRDAYNLDYHLQCGCYTTGFKKQKFRFPDYVNIVVETSEPFCVNVFRADSRYIEQGQNEFHNSMLAFKYAIDNNEFHKGYAFHRFATRYNRMDLPGYAKSVFG